MNSVSQAHTARSHICCEHVTDDPLRATRASALAYRIAEQWPLDEYLNLQTYREFLALGWTRPEFHAAVNDLVSSGRARLRGCEDGEVTIVLLDRDVIEQTWAWRDWHRGQEGTEAVSDAEKVAGATSEATAVGNAAGKPPRRLHAVED